MSRPKIKLTFFNDPGHGWLRVPRHLIKKETLEKITGFSYQNGNYVYLEEDLDAQLFIEQIGEHNITITNKWTNNDSQIRTFQPFYHNPEQDKKEIIHNFVQRL